MKILFFILTARISFADEAAQDSWFHANIQSTVISQTLFHFRDPYDGPNSLLSRDETEVTYANLLSLKENPVSNVLIDTDVAYTRGQGVGGGNATGLAGFSNDQVIRISSVNKDAYFARFFMQWTQPLSRDDRLVVSVGKMATNDIFEKNSYANSVDTQFINWGMVNDLAYDFAADTRGYSGGIAFQWIHPNWALRFGSFQMPVRPNGIRLAGNFGNNRGDQLELELHPRLGNASPSTLRVMAYQNHAHMGNYNEAIALAPQTGGTPNLIAVEKFGSVKTGFALNGEQPLADDGETGLFWRYGWNDGQTESFAYTEADRFASVGMQLSGKRWNQPLDHVGLGLEQSDLSAPHARYLALGGAGFQLGDGALNYGSERIAEAYYSHGISKNCAVSLDFQRAINPGYNRDRGPASFLSFRFHVEH